MSAESWTADEIESWRRRHRISHGRYPENCDEHCRWLETLDAARARLGEVERKLSNYVETHSGQPADGDGASWVPCDCAMCEDARAALARGAEASEA